jgi:DNA-binding NarL/FixJ family response regulator
MGKIRILIADDHTILRHGIKEILLGEEDFDVIADVGDGRDAVKLVQELFPDVVLMDISMPNMNGLEATRQIIKKVPETRVLALTMYEDRDYVHLMRKAGASGYILKDTAANELVDAIRAISNGSEYFSPAIAAKLDESGVHRAVESELDVLTDREREVLQLLAEGKSIREAGEILDISPKTVEAHKTNLMKKLNIHNRVALTKFAIQHKLIALN